MPAPPAPFVPTELAGQARDPRSHGPRRRGLRRACRPSPHFARSATPVADMLRPMPYPDIYPPDDGGDYHPLAVSHTMFIDHVGRDVASTIVDHLEASDALPAGRTAPRPRRGDGPGRVDDTAFAHRTSRIMVNADRFLRRHSRRSAASRQLGHGTSPERSIRVTQAPTSTSSAT